MSHRKSSDSSQLRLDLLLTCAAPDFPTLFAELVRHRIARGLEHRDVQMSVLADGRELTVQSWVPGGRAHRQSLPLSA